MESFICPGKNSDFFFWENKLWLIKLVISIKHLKESNRKCWLLSQVIAQNET